MSAILPLNRIFRIILTENRMEIVNLNFKIVLLGPPRRVDIFLYFTQTEFVIKEGTKKQDFSAVIDQYFERIMKWGASVPVA